MLNQMEPNNLWEVIGVQKNNNAHIQWDKEYLHKGDAPVTCKWLLKTRYNKKTQGHGVCVLVTKLGIKKVNLCLNVIL